LLPVALAVFSALAGWFLGRPAFYFWRHGSELTLTIQQFRQVEFDLDTRLHPELILTVAADDYVPIFTELNKVGRCDGCDRFWVTTSAEVRWIRVITYSPTMSRVRAEVVTRGHMVDSTTFEPLSSYEAPLQDEATYVLIRDHASEPWKVQAIEDFEAWNPQ
jgi:hypothetical protein